MRHTLAERGRLPAREAATRHQSRWVVHGGRCLPQTRYKNSGLMGCKRRDVQSTSSVSGPARSAALCVLGHLHLTLAQTLTAVAAAVAAEHHHRHITQKRHQSSAKKRARSHLAARRRLCAPPRYVKARVLAAIDAHPKKSKSRKRGRINSQSKIGGLRLPSASAARLLQGHVFVTLSDSKAAAGRHDEHGGAALSQAAHACVRACW
jgi:hypothetical protein